MITVHVNLIECNRSPVQTERNRDNRAGLMTEGSPGLDSSSLFTREIIIQMLNQTTHPTLISSRMVPEALWEM